MAEASPPSGVEILCIGTELLLGNIVNGNARWLAEQLATLGLPHYRQTVVGDNRERLIAEVQAISRRSRVLITTGGLGPTPDDLTTEAIAAAFSTALEERPEVWDDITAKARSRGRQAGPETRRQALLPLGATLLPNATGTAPGMIWSPVEGFTVLTFPGVPSEMRAMWQATAVPWFEQSGLSKGVFSSRLMRFWGIGESSLAEQLHDLLDQTNPTVAPYAGRGEVKLRITAHAAAEVEALRLLDSTEAELRQRTGKLCFGCDEQSLACVVLEQLRMRKQTLAVAESCTGGGLGAELTAIPGSSDVLLGGVIAYSNAVKQHLLGVSAELLEQFGAVSDPVAQAMAEGARRVTGSDWSMAITGIAGPGGGTDEKPVGLVHIAVAGPDGCFSQPIRLGETRGRNWVRTVSVGEALNRLRLRLMEAG
ncbi:putative competence-damage inducible protein [Synechococcus sp. MIT S9509]|uniref:competence/damage-inducible protein A n=1 Tax=unclassified Synechococcus TaxID=2626047 RepID=UPI0007BBF8EE|nr:MULTISPECIES: competence/damage-inducible protein A [unclassified Synechococcus]KZR85696.1 putative competence-damage inducible protein [Synechococcus sp. MIT S9504]KZR93665.1 putative competence-damage inducible protein [Synechococcus sp. MIT S9509]